MAILSVKIDVTKLQKDLFFTGAKGTYADLTILLRDEPDQYNNDGFISQDIGKEARLAGEKGPIVGNVKWIKRDDQPSAPPTNDPGDSYRAAADASNQGEAIPF
jgi:hypothetical protein|tara:strand:+ start:279 stop:590 length:312 start_codon:yes stop_codon:yes gene_type:complete